MKKITFGIVLLTIFAFTSCSLLSENEVAPSGTEAGGLEGLNGKAFKNSELKFVFGESTFIDTFIFGGDEHEGDTYTYSYSNNKVTMITNLTATTDETIALEGKVLGTVSSDGKTFTLSSDAETAYGDDLFWDVSPLALVEIVFNP